MVVLIYDPALDGSVRGGTAIPFPATSTSLNIDPDDIEHRITPHTKVIMAVHLRGNPAEMDPILAIARKHKLRALEDGSQSVGASYKGRPLGSCV